MLDRTKAPEIQEIETVSLPTAEVTQLQNGGRLHFIKNKTQPIIRLDFVFKAGKWYEPKPGVSDLANKMLFEGSVQYSAKQIAEKIAYYGASFENNHGYDRTEFTLYCLSKHLKTLLPVVLDVIQHPTFPEPEFDMLKQRNQQNLKVQRQKNSYLATHTFTKLIYGENHPYIFGFEENALDTIQIAELKAFYQQYLKTKDLEIFACGDIDSDAEKLIAQEVGNINFGADITLSEEAEINSQYQLSKDYKFVTVEDSLQSSIRLGKVFPSISHPDYLKLVVVSEVLGGYFGSRLMRNIREDKGYTYGIYSTISSKEKDSMFYIGTDVNYNVTNDTVNEIHKEIKLLQEELVQDDELQTVKSYMLGKFLNDITTIFEQCDRYKKTVLNGLPQEHYSNYIKTIKSISAEEIKKLATTYLDIKGMSTAIAGRKAAD